MATFDAPIDIVEAMGSDVYAYFVVKGEGAHSADLDDLAKDTGNDLHSDGTPVTARLDAASHVQRGKTAKLWFDTSKVHVFDVESGLNLAPGGQDRDDVERSPARLNGSEGGFRRVRPVGSHLRCVRTAPDPWYHSGIFSGMAMTLRLTDAETEALRAQAEIEGRSMQDVARGAVRRYIEQYARRGNAWRVVTRS